MNKLEKVQQEPYGFDYLSLMRELERSEPYKPRIGKSSVMREDVVTLEQNPFLEFPASNLENFESRKDAPPRVTLRFLGFFGPQGALPLTTTVEALNWIRGRDESFAAFTNLFSNRFLQLFFRAWSDSRAITQADRPDYDRFYNYLGSFAGIGTSAYRRRDALPDIMKLPFAGLVNARVKSANRLRNLLRGLFQVDVEVQERIGSWLTFEPDDMMSLGAAGSSLGSDTFIGQRVYTINEKIRISIKVESLEHYEQFLPGAALSEKLTDAIFLYFGHRYEFDVELALPAHLAPPMKLGEAGRLGWTSWVSPDPEEKPGAYRRDARIAPMERRLAAELTEMQAKAA